MDLHPGDPQPAAISALQRQLNETGAILLVDGDFGPGTALAVARANRRFGLPDGTTATDALFDLLANVPPLFPFLGAAGVTFIARCEVASMALYERSFHLPSWPSSTSGVTIGIGYDLQFATQERLTADWGARLPAASIRRLTACCGRVGSSALRRSVADVDVPFDAAMDVLLGSTLPAVIDETRGIYPQIDDLSPPRRAALVSLVYNRGHELDGDRRREMRAIRDLLAAGRPDAVASQFDSMARLWDPRKLPGLVRRRHDEARMWRSGYAAVGVD